MDKAMTDAFEKYRKKIYGVHNSYPIDAITNFCAGWKAAVAVERERGAHIALAIDSKRGNEKEIARAIRAQTT